MAIVVPNIQVQPYKQPPKNSAEEQKRREMEGIIAPLVMGSSWLNRGNIGGNTSLISLTLSSFVYYEKM